MITIQHQETEKNGVFEAWLRATEEGACTEPVQVGEMTYVRPTPERMIIDHTRVFEGFEGRGPNPSRKSRRGRNVPCSQS